MSNHDEVAIRARVDDYVQAHNRGDAKGAAAVYAPDGSHAYAMGFVDRGREQIQTRLREMFAGPWKGLQLVLEIQSLRFLGPTVAVGEERFEVRGLHGADGGPLPPIQGLTLIVWTKRGEEWFVAAGQGMIPFSPPA